MLHELASHLPVSFIFLTTTWQDFNRGRAGASSTTPTSLSLFDVSSNLLELMAAHSLLYQVPLLLHLLPFPQCLTAMLSQSSTALLYSPQYLAAGILILLCRGMSSTFMAFTFSSGLCSDDFSFSNKSFSSSTEPHSLHSHAASSHATHRSSFFSLMAFFNTVRNSQSIVLTALQTLSSSKDFPISRRHAQVSPPLPPTPEEGPTPLGRKPPWSTCPLGDT